MFHKAITPTFTNLTYFTAPVRVASRAPDLYLATLGQFTTNGCFDFEQVSGGYAIHVVRSGKGTMCIGKRQFTVAAGDVFAFFPRWHIRYWDHPESPWRYTWLTLGGRMARGALASVGLTEKTPHLKNVNLAEPMERLFNDVIKGYATDHVPAAFAVAAAWRFIDGMARTVPEEKPVEPIHLAARARFLVDHAYMRLTGVTDIAAHLGVSRATLFRQFRDAYQMSPKQYLDAVRLEQARQLLVRQRNLSVKEIAMASGYRDAHYFSRAFRRHHGKPPGLWRMHRK